MKNETNTGGTTVDELFNEFDFAVPGIAVEGSTGDGVPNPIETELTEEQTVAEEAAIAKEEAETAEAARLAAEGGEPAKPKKEEAAAPKGESTSFYKKLALKYIENGKWDSALAIEDEEGNQIPIEDIEDLNEETFFEIEKALSEAEEEDRKTKFVSIADMDERKKNLISIIKEGGELSDIFKSEAQVQEYLNPFGNLDLDNESVQERVLYNALINHNKLDPESAQVVVNKAKKDFTLDTKVKTYIDGYTKSFDKFVEDKKKSLIEEKETKRKELADFKKSLTEEYKAYGLNDSLVRRLTNSVVKEAEDGYEIDVIYDQKMKDPKEAAELVLFLNDKEAYLESKLKNSKIQEQKKTRRLFKMVPKEKGTGSKENDTTNVDNEFDFKVPAI